MIKSLSFSNAVITLIKENQKRVNIIAELQDSVSMIEDHPQEAIKKIQKVIQDLMI